MATVVVQQSPTISQPTSTTPPLTPALTLNVPRSPTPVPNKHIPYCSPGPAPLHTQTVTPPNSPPLRNPSPKPSSILHPPDAHPQLLQSPPIYGLSADKLAAALEELATRPMTNPDAVFPWLHGLHPDNHTQLAFFVVRKRSLRRVPVGLRAITLIKAGGDLSRARIKSAVAPDEVMSLCDDEARGFIECDPPEGFSVRNFHIQTAKLAPLSDIVVYGDDRTDHRIIKSVAERAAAVQRHWRRQLEQAGQTPESFNTFVLTSPFADFERSYPHLVAINARGKATGQVIDFLLRERIEMCEMTRASAISHGVSMGPSPNPAAIPVPAEGDVLPFDIYIECSDHSPMPEDAVLAAKRRQLHESSEPVHLSFPSSGSIMPPAWSRPEADGVLRMCHWIYDMTHTSAACDSSADGDADGDGDIPMTELNHRPRKVLFHCADGYTETSLLAVAYFMFAEGLPLRDAWIRLHVDQQRNFFAYPSDVALLKAMQERLLSESPALAQREGKADPPTLAIPTWLHKLDGSLPSRILPHMYLGNLTHANNPDMLRKLGIGRILSIGEPVSWPKAEWDTWGRQNLLYVDRIQDNGIDELSAEIQRCLDFLAHSHDEGKAVLVHCRVGVSRSATICIAEVMARKGLSFPRAYCFVRARRLNVIIQPHLRFVYELMKWDEIQQAKRGEKVSRELEWASVAREIAAMNRPYARG